MKKKGFLLIDGSKNAVILNTNELPEELMDLLRKRGIMETVKKHKTNKDLYKTVSDYLKGEWNDGESE